MTARLRLEPLSAVHIDDLHQLSVDPDVRRYLFKDQVIPRQRVEQMVAASEAYFAQVGTGFYALVLNQPDAAQHGQFVGFCGLRRFVADERQTELLLGVDPNIWGRGIGVEAAQAVLQRAFASTEVAEVVAAADTPNQRSIRVLQKLGMSFQERREWHGWDTMFYAIAAEEFAQQSA